MSSDVNSNIQGEDLQSRFKVLEKPTIHPGHCICCGSVERPVVDFGVEVDYEALGFGALLLCKFCVLQAASRFEAPAKDEPPHYTEEDFNAWKQGFLDDLRSFTNQYAVTHLALPVWGSRDSISQQTESKDNPESERESESVSGTTVEADKPARGKRAPRISGSTGDGSSSFLDL